MSDDRVTICESASSGFIRTRQEHGPYELGSGSPRTDKSLRGQVRQKAREVDSSQVWNTYCFLLDAHKPTGERHVSAQPRASSVLLGGRRTPTTHTHEYDSTRGGRIDA